MFTLQHLLMIALFYIWAAGTGLFYIVTTDGHFADHLRAWPRRVALTACVLGWPVVVIIGTYQEIQLKLKG